MSTRADYTDEEWEAIRQTPAAAMIALEQASPSGILGRRRERKAQERGLAAIISGYSGMGLVDALVAAAHEEGRRIDALREAGRPLIDEAIASAAVAHRAIAAKGSKEEHEAYVNSVLGLCETVAAADRERGEDVLSKAEAILLHRLAAALGRPDYTPGDPEFTPPGLQTPVIKVGLEGADDEQGIGQQRR
jgi:hypothetical protein